ncbi:hypothetical protein HBB16_11180 [Pseudonocardia sp. MCCB 268]|nr:hypothetical protein [Pseudonocardia cytotoxica]
MFRVNITLVEPRRRHHQGQRAGPARPPRSPARWTDRAHALGAGATWLVSCVRCRPGSTTTTTLSSCGAVTRPADRRRHPARRCIHAGRRSYPTRETQPRRAGRNSSGAHWATSVTCRWPPSRAACPRDRRGPGQPAGGAPLVDRSGEYHVRTSGSPQRKDGRRRRPHPGRVPGRGREGPMPSGVAYGAAACRLPGSANAGLDIRLMPNWHHAGHHPRPLGRCRMTALITADLSTRRRRPTASRGAGPALVDAGRVTDLTSSWL